MKKLKIYRSVQRNVHLKEPYYNNIGPYTHVSYSNDPGI